MSTTGVGHKSLSIFVRFAPNLQSVFDPDSTVRKLTCLRLSTPDASKEICLLRGHTKTPWGYFYVSTTGVEPARANAHYPLKVARLPISPRGHE